MITYTVSKIGKDKNGKDYANISAEDDFGIIETRFFHVNLKKFKFKAGATFKRKPLW